MTVLNHAIEIGVSSPKDFLSKLRTFAIAQGWTVDTYETDKNWVNGTGFVSGGGSGEDYLFISSSGFGSQSLFYRLATRNINANNNFIECGAFLDNVFETNTSTKPHLQTDKWNTNTLSLGMPDGAILKTWFFGNDKCLHAVNLIESDYLEHMFFGSVELFDTTEAEGYFSGYSRTTTLQEWFDKNADNPYDRLDRSLYYNGSAKSAADAKTNFTCNKTSVTGTAFFSYGQVLTSNNFSPIRPLEKQIYFVEDLDGQWLPLGNTWAFRLDFTGLNIGQSYFFGAEEYLVFPYGKQGENNGVAFRIA